MKVIIIGLIDNNKFIIFIKIIYYFYVYCARRLIYEHER